MTIKSIIVRRLGEILRRCAFRLQVWTPPTRPAHQPGHMGQVTSSLIAYNAWPDAAKHSRR